MNNFRFLFSLQMEKHQRRQFEGGIIKDIILICSTTTKNVLPRVNHPSPFHVGLLIRSRSRHCPILNQTDNTFLRMITFNMCSESSHMAPLNCAIKSGHSRLKSVSKTDTNTVREETREYSCRNESQRNNFPQRVLKRAFNQELTDLHGQSSHGQFRTSMSHI